MLFINLTGKLFSTSARVIILGKPSSCIAWMSLRFFWKCPYWTGSISTTIRQEALSWNLNVTSIAVFHTSCDQGAWFFSNRCYPKSKQHLLHEAIRRYSVRRASRFESRLQLTSQNCANSFLNQIIHGVQSNPDRCLHIFYSSAGLLQDMLGSSNLFKYLVQKT